MSNKKRTQSEEPAKLVIHHGGWLLAVDYDDSPDGWRERPVKFAKTHTEGHAAQDGLRYGTAPL